jgi:hypothetical protein
VSIGPKTRRGPRVVAILEMLAHLVPDCRDETEHLGDLLNLVSVVVVVGCTGNPQTPSPFRPTLDSRAI